MQIQRIRERGAILLTVIILLTIVTIIGVGMINTMTVSEKEVGSYRNRVSLEYIAETGLTAAILKLKAVAAGTDPTIDWLNGIGKMCAPDTGMVVCVTDNCGAGTVGVGGPECPPFTKCCSSEPACPEGQPDDSDMGASTQNVMCNFLGSSFKGGRVILIRKGIYADTANTPPYYEQFLINIEAYGPNSTRRILQVGLLMQYSNPVNPPNYGPVTLVSRRWLND